LRILERLLYGTQERRVSSAHIGFFTTAVVSSGAGQERCGPAKRKLKPFLEDTEGGLFATRAPCRPNVLGMSVVRLLRRGQALRRSGGEL
jgi:tRNA (Thr-GGU) A37 N-methylase